MKDDKSLKISFTGDLMCELPLLRLHKKGDFSGIAMPLKDIYNSSYVVSNLETVFAGKKAGYTKDVYSFNSPDSFIKVVKEAQIDLVSTANNHCLDRGVKGLERTIQILEENGIEHTGTFCRRLEENFLIKELNGIRIGFVSYTYGTNYGINKNKLNEKDEYRVNLLKPQDVGYMARQGVFNKLKDTLFRTETRIKLKKFLGMSYNHVRSDYIQNGDIDESYLSDGKFTAFSLGNYLISPNSVYILNDNSPEFSIVLHVYIREGCVEKLTFSVAYINFNEEKETRIFDSYEYAQNHYISQKYVNDISKICSIFSGIQFDNSFTLQKEYQLGDIR